jgi:phosphatidylserine decarboxylase
MRIHREGRLILFIALVLMVGVVLIGEYLVHLPAEIMDFLIITTAAIYLFILQFFRNPNIAINENEHLILAAADGKVVVIEETNEEEYLKERRVQVSIFMSPVNVHINRSPVAGKVVYFKYHPGKYLVAWHPKSSTENERTTLVIETTGGLKLLVRQIAGIMARRIRYYKKEGDILQQGQEFGFIKFGSRVDMFLPLNAKILVKPGDRVTAGITPIAGI